MWNSQRENYNWIRRFFFLNLSHDNLENYYRTNFQLLNNFHYSLSELDEMIPWEREIYITMLLQHLEEKAAKQQG